MTKISLNDIPILIKKNIENTLTIAIKLSNKINTNIFSSDGYFNTKSIYSEDLFIKNKDKTITIFTIVNKNSILHKVTNYKLDKPVTVNFYKIRNKNGVSKNIFKLCKNSYKKIVGNWTIQLITEKEYEIDNNAKIANFDKKDRIYIEILYNKKLIYFADKDLFNLNSFIKVFIKTADSFIKTADEFIKKSGGMPYEKSIETENYTMKVLNDFIHPHVLFKKISDIFSNQKLLNRTDYFALLNDFDKNLYCINNNYAGIDSIIIIDSNNIYKIETNKIETNKIETNKIETKCGNCVIHATRFKNIYTIKKVIVYDNTLVIYKTVDQINEMNKKVSEILKIEYINYKNINLSNYKKCIETHNKLLLGDIDYIELSRVDIFFDATTIYKWSPSRIPITFYCVECPPAYLKNYRVPKNQILYILYLSINITDLKNSGIENMPFHNEIFMNSNKNQFEPIQFSPSVYPNAYLFYSNKPDLHKKFVNLWFDYIKKLWVFINITNDVDYPYGDNFKIVETQVWNSYRNPVSYSDLIIDKKKISESMYFVALKNKIHEAPIKFNNFVKAHLINTYASKSVIDLASGRASDLMNYRLANVKNLLFCEIDKDAVDVVLERKYRLDNPNNTVLKIFNTNLNDSYKINLNEIQKTYDTKKVSSIFCLFALHYLTDTIDRINNITTLISSLLEKNGVFIYTAFSGSSIIKLMDDNNGKWEVVENGVKKYSIISKYTQSDIKTPKRLIKLILPFNINTHYYDENLINEKLLDNAFAKNNLNIISEGSFMGFVDKFKDKKYNFYNKLTAADKIFIGLYKYKIYKKTK